MAEQRWQWASKDRTSALRYVSNPELISRILCATWSKPVCADVSDVFGFCPRKARFRAASLGQARPGAGLILAPAARRCWHPGRYRLNDTALWALIEEFREAGGTGIEVVCGSHTRDQYGRFAGIAREFGLRASRGSDFHGPGESHVELGQLPPLPDAVVPVWYDWPVAGRRS
jgi:hypothetical protein